MADSALQGFQQKLCQAKRRKECVLQTILAASTGAMRSQSATCYLRPCGAKRRCVARHLAAGEYSNLASPLDTDMLSLQVQGNGQRLRAKLQE